MSQTDRSRNAETGNLSGSAVKLMIWCLPATVLLLISVFLIGIIPSRTSLASLVMIAAMGLIITRVIFLLRSPRKIGVKAALSVVWLVIFVVAGFFNIFMPRVIHHVMKADAQSRFEADIRYMLLPRSDFAPMEVGTTESIELHTFSRTALIFESSSRILLCRYHAEEYEKAIASMAERFRFRTEPLGTGYYGDDHAEITDDPYAVIADGCFRILAPGDGDDSDFYKGCFLVMTNDIKHQIGYIAFSDPDLDVTESLEYLINEECGWKYLHL